MPTCIVRLLRSSTTDANLPLRRSLTEGFENGRSLRWLSCRPNQERPRRCALFVIHARIISLRGNDGAVAASRHQAILHLAGRRQIMRQPQSHCQQDNRDGQSCDGGAPVSTLVGVGHGAVIPGTINWRWRADIIAAGDRLQASAAIRRHRPGPANARAQATDTRH